MKAKKDFKVLFVYSNLMLQTTFPMGIALLSSILKRDGFEVDIFDTTFYQTEEITSDEARVENLQIAKFTLGKEFQNLPQKEQLFQDLRLKVESYKPDLIAFSIIEDIFSLTVELVKAVKSYNIPAVAGGVFATFAPERVIALDGISYVCRGEGEEAIPELCEALRTKSSTTNIKNMWVKDGGKIIKNPMRPLRDLNLNPQPDFELFDDRRFNKPMKGKIYRMGLVETNRGCPYSCAFCNSYSQRKLYSDEVGARYFRSQSISKIYDEIKTLRDKYRIEYIYFPAEVFFAGSKEYIKEFVEMYKKFKIPFFCQNRAEVINEDTVQYLVDMGCQSLALGIEHGNEAFRRDRLNRKVKNETYLSAMKLLEKTDIKVSVNNILGFPDETRELVFDTIRLNRNFNVYQINAYFFSPYYGTSLRDYCVEKEYIPEDSLISCVTKDSILKMPEPYLSRDDIRGLVRTFNLYARFPEERFPEIAIAEKNTDEGNRMFNKLKDEYWNNFLLVK